MDYTEVNNSFNDVLKKQKLIIDLNKDWNPFPEISGSSIGTILLVVSVIGVLTSIVCLIYVTRFLQANDINKLLLRSYAIEMILCFTTCLIGHIILPFFQNIWSCSLIIRPAWILYYLCTNTAMCISIIRYYIKFKATQSEIVELEDAVTFIKLNKVFSYLVCTISILGSWVQLGAGFRGKYFSSKVETIPAQFPKYPKLFPKVKLSKISRV